MRTLSPWVKLPNAWIESGRLKEFRWANGKGADQLAALMGLTVISHHVDAESGVAHLTYDDLCRMTSLSRAKLSAGLKILAQRGLIERDPEGRSSYRLANYNPDRGWAQFPAKGLYKDDLVAAFENFRLRLPAELDALKLLFLFASRRDRQANVAKISYEKIESYSGIARNNIKRALSVLSANSLVYVEHMKSNTYENGIVNVYRLPALESRRHMGTTGRAIDNFAEE